MTDDQTISAPGANTERLVLAGDQQAACESLLGVARVRARTNETILPYYVLRRWSAPCLVGPAASGKEFVCQEVARRLGNRSFRRWDVGAWVIQSNRSTGTTLEQIERFIEESPSGCVVYLSGVDSLTPSGDSNVSYRRACVSEIEQFLDWTCARRAHFFRRDGSTFQANVLVVLGGRFGALWGESELSSPVGAESWKNADADPLEGTQAVRAWIERHSQIPTSIVRRLAAEPLVLRPVTQEEAIQVASRIQANLPPSLDGIDAREFVDALLGPHGWRGVANVIEQALFTGHEEILPVKPVVGEPPVPVPEKPTPPVAKPVTTPTKKNRPMRLADRLSITPHRSALLAKARKLGILTGGHLEALALARGYTLPGESILVPPIYSSDAWTDEFGDADLAFALLSPGLEFSERSICRGTFILLRLVDATEPYVLARAAIKEHSRQVLRHVAGIGLRCNPHHPRWRTLAGIIGLLSNDLPALPEGAMPDDAIFDVFTRSGFGEVV